MKKFVSINYTFAPLTKTVDLYGIVGFDIKLLVSIINQTTGTVIYATASSDLKYTSVTGTSIVLNYDTTSMSATDVLQVIYEVNDNLATIGDPAPSVMQLAGYVDKYGNIQPALVTENDAVSVGNFIQKFRDGFVNAAPDLTVWDESWTNQNTGFVSQGGNSSGSSFLKVSMCPLSENSEYTLTSKRSFKFPVRFAYGLSASQKILGQWFDVSLVGVDNLGNIEESASKPDLNILGNIVIASNVATVNFATAHGLNGGDRVVLYGNTDSRLNVGPVIVTVVTATQITVPCTATSGTLIAGGVVKWADPLGLVSNAVGVLYETTSTTTAAFVARRNGAKFRYLSTSMSSTIATQSNTSPYTEAFNAAGDMEIVTSMDDVVYYARSSDSISAASYTGRFSQGLPDEEKEYKIRLRVRNSFGYTIPVAKIVNISKSGSTTATVTTDVPHGLTVTDYVQVYGVRDIVGFPNLTAQTIVSSVISATQFTVIIGSSATVSSNGGGVWKVQGSTLAPGVYAQNIQSIARTNNVMTVTFNTTVSTTLSGETVHIYGCNATAMGLYDGAYKVLRASTTALELESIGADFTSIICGGTVIKRTDVRLHYVRIADYTRHSVEVSNARGGLDAARSMPVTGAVTVSSGTVTSVTSVVAANISIPTIIADAASAAITTSATTATIIPTYGLTYQVNIPVTAVTGTSPIMDVIIQESDDTGVNWYDVYHFPRITATSMNRSPVLTMMGNRIRYVQTIAGTSPSFTRSINRLQSSITDNEVNRQLFDRTIVLTTLNSVTPSLLVEGVNNLQLVVNIGTATVAPVVQLQVSEDGLNYTNIGSSLTAIASSTVLTSVTNIRTKFVRAIVVTAGTTVVAGFVQLKGF